MHIAAAAWADTALGALWGGLALAKAALGAVHGLAGPLGGMLPGAPPARSALLPHVMAVNVAALRLRSVVGAGLARFAEAARLLTGRPDARAADGAAWLHDLGAALAVPGLATFGLTRDHFPDLISKAVLASSMKGNPVPLTENELSEIVERAL